MLHFKNIIFLLFSIIFLFKTTFSKGVSFNSKSTDYDPFKLTREELLQLNEDYDPGYEKDVGKFVGDFFSDSSSQLIIDLDLFKQLWNELNEMRQAAIDGDVDYIRDVIKFLEPITKYDISAPCLSDLTHFLMTIYNYAVTANSASKCNNCSCTEEYREEFRKFQWIFDVVDAMGKVPAAVVSGNNLWTGSWATCRKISARKNKQGQLWQGQYCMARFQPYNRHSPLKAFSGQPTDPTAVCRGNATKSTHFDDWSDYEKTCFDMMPLLNLGLCTPDSCTDYDVRKIVQFVYESAELALNTKLVCNVSVQCSNSRPENQIYHDQKSMAVLFLLFAIASLMLFGTCYDVYVHRPLEKSLKIQRLRLNGGNGKPVSVEPQSKFVTIIRLFSVARNLDYILDTRMEEGQIRCLHGARFLSMCWVIFGHTYYYIYNLLQTMQEFTKFFYNQMVVQAPLAVDSFFLLSGLLTSYIFLVKLQKKQFRLNSFSTWFAYYVRRYLRLTPVYLFVMILLVTVLNYISEGPFWQPIDPNFCRNSWWTNLLYINNFVLQADSCMGWTWYLANDFQLYAFAPILIIALHRYKMGGVFFGILLLFLSSVFTVIITIIKGYPPAPLLTTKLQIIANLKQYWSDLYVKPYIRCGPYIVGCIVGYFLSECKRQRENRFQLTKLQWVLGWSISAILGFYSIFGLYEYTRTGDISLWYSLTYAAIGRLSFAIALGWIAFACETNHGQTMNAILGHKMFIPLSKITFCAYLLHPILLQLYYFSRPSAFHFTHSFQLLLMFFAAVFCVYGCALLLSLAMEVPVAHIDKLIFGPGGGGSQRLPSTARSNTGTSDKSGEQHQLQDFEDEGTEIKKESTELKLLSNDEKIEKEEIK
uniref:Nose resistant-to-fluoxetine protein N-terminal domain-containing protein n=1 Tax=Meloidogyne enterolobii TaxID=390850 RepID=A0A6V7W0G0_MELEN|nr:unnamed protein product [Meloidogyne enterolobii]